MRQTKLIEDAGSEGQKAGVRRVGECHRCHAWIQLALLSLPGIVTVAFVPGFGFGSERFTGVSSAAR